MSHRIVKKPFTLIDGSKEYNIPNKVFMFYNRYNADYIWELDDNNFKRLKNEFNYNKHTEDKQMGNDFIPFGTGVRKCLSQRLAELETSIFLIKFFKRYRIK